MSVAARRAPGVPTAPQPLHLTTEGDWIEAPGKGGKVQLNFETGGGSITCTPVNQNNWAGVFNGNVKVTNDLIVDHEVDVGGQLIARNQFFGQGPAIFSSTVDVTGKLECDGGLRVDGQYNTFPTPVTNVIDVGRWSDGVNDIWARGPSGATSLRITAQPFGLVAPGGTVAVQPSLTVTGDTTITGRTVLSSTAGGMAGGITCESYGQFKGNLISEPPGSLQANGQAAFANGLSEYGRTFKMGDWVPVAFNAANFSATGGGSWTVPSVQSNFYAVVGRTVTYTVQLFNSTITGTVITLRINLPAGFVAQANAGTVSAWSVDGTNAYQPMIVEARPGLSQLVIQRINPTFGAAIAPGAQMGIYLQIQFPI
jgi:hypothetical protein